MRRNIFICLLLTGITLALYWPVGHFDVVGLDDIFFTDTPEVRDGLNRHSFLWAMTATVVANWHPVTTLSFVLTHQLFGNNPGAEHLVNVAIHALNVVLLFWVLVCMTGRKVGAESDTVWRCALVAALFAWHPFRVESVAWISERKDVLCAFFFLLTLWFYAQSLTGGRWRAAGGVELAPATSNHRSGFFWLALVSFTLALLSKAMAVTLPFVLLLLDVWPLQRAAAGKWRVTDLKRIGLEKWPFFALAIIFSVVTFLVQRNESATPPLSELGAGLRLENVIVSYWRYLGWMFWPNKLAVYYAFPYDNHFYLGLWPGWVIAGSALLLAGVSALCVKQLSNRPYLAVGWFWYLGMMVPVIGLVQVGGQGMADRYTYLPLIGPVISLIWLVAEQWGKKPFFKIGAITFAAVILAASIGQTRQQLQFWKNSDTLFQHTVEVTGENPHAEYLLGLSLEQEGRIDEAVVHYRNAITSQPRVKDAFCSLGRIFAQQGKWKESEYTFSTLLADAPNNFNAHLGLATALPHLGRNAEATIHLKLAVENCPDTPDALNNLAWTLATNENTELRDGVLAVKYAERACKLTNYRETIMIGTLGAAYAEAGRFDEAMATAQSACDLASKSGAEPLLKINRQLLELYQQHHPYREITSPALQSINPAP